MHREWKLAEGIEKGEILAEVERQVRDRFDRQTTLVHAVALPFLRGTSLVRLTFLSKASDDPQSASVWRSSYLLWRPNTPQTSETIIPLRRDVKYLQRVYKKLGLKLTSETAVSFIKFSGVIWGVRNFDHWSELPPSSDWTEQKGHMLYGALAASTPIRRDGSIDIKVETNSDWAAGASFKFKLPLLYKGAFYTTTYEVAEDGTASNDAQQIISSITMNDPFYNGEHHALTPYNRFDGPTLLDRLSFARTTTLLGIIFFAAIGGAAGCLIALADSLISAMSSSMSTAINNYLRSNIATPAIAVSCAMAIATFSSHYIYQYYVDYIGKRRPGAERQMSEILLQHRKAISKGITRRILATIAIGSGRLAVLSLLWGFVIFWLTYSYGGLFESPSIASLHDSVVFSVGRLSRAFLAGHDVAAAFYAAPFTSPATYLGKGLDACIYATMYLAVAQDILRLWKESV